jgi:hypothetical protein
MDDSKVAKDNNAKGQRLAERKSEATSDETLSDIEEDAKSTPSSGTPADPGPSPDGRLDESDELKDAGPM